VVERRKKNRSGGNKGKAAGKGRSRSRKTRLERKESAATHPELTAPKPEGRPDPAETGVSAGQAPEEPRPAPKASSETPKVTLPGELYLRTDQWWWRVKLPGEDKARARPLTPEGTKVAPGDRETAEKVAFATWEHAVEEHAAKQVKLESAEKIERLKAQFLDKVRHFTELVETANAKIEAEAKARAEAEAKLAEVLQAAGPSMEDGGQRTEGGQRTGDRGQSIQQGAVPARQGEIAPVDSAAVGAAAGASQTANGRSEGKPPPTQEAPHGITISEPRQPPLSNATPPSLSAAPPLETGVCECCGATGVAMACLTRIDSGQSLCPRCLAALRADVARIDADVSN